MLAALIAGGPGHHSPLLDDSSFIFSSFPTHNSCICLFDKALEFNSEKRLPDRQEEVGEGHCVHGTAFSPHDSLEAGRESWCLARVTEEATEAQHDTVIGTGPQD